MSGYELLSDQGLRADGRRANELRRIRCRQGVFGQADGSAYLDPVICLFSKTTFLQNTQFFL